LEAGVNDEQKLEALNRLLAVQKMLRSVADAATLAAEEAEEAEATGLSFAVLMVRESILAYSKELNRWAETRLDK
jgi:hypothetical protein